MHSTGNLENYNNDKYTPRGGVKIIVDKMATNTDAHVGRDGLFEKFKELNIEVVTVEHPEVFTVEEMMPHVQHLPGAHCKNLFLRDKKKRLYLFSCRHDLDVKLNDLSKKVGASGCLRFADESILFEKMGVKQGCVTAFGLINDKNKDVKFVVDEALIGDKFERIFFHPLTNAASSGIAPKDFLKFLEAVDHAPTSVSLEA